MLLSILVWLAALTAVRASEFAGAKVLSMGGGLVAGVPVENAAFLNPSGLADTTNFSTSFSQAKILSDTLAFQIGTAIPLKAGKWGIGIGWGSLVARDQVQTELVRDANGQLVVDPLTGLALTRLTGFFTRNDNQGILSVGYRWGGLRLGLSGKYLLTQFGGLKGRGFGTDLGANVQWTKRVDWGLVFYDLGDTKLRFQDTDFNETYPSTAQTTLLLKPAVGKDFSACLAPGLGLPLKSRSAVRWNGGLEVGYRGSLFLRGGVNRDRSSFGVGLVAHPAKVFREVRVDYAFLGGTGTGPPSRLTIAVTW